MKVCVLASGSLGNMTYIETDYGKFLIDAGISLVNAQERVKDINFKEITDIFITHEHNDHIKFLDTIVKKTNANIFINKKSYEALKIETKDKLVGRKIGFLDPDSRYKIKDINLYTLSLVHDTASTFGFIIEEIDSLTRVGYFTDTGIFPIRYKSLISTLDLLIIECNHNIEMLQNSDRDYSLINRILSTNGHMSNNACFELLDEYLTPRTKHVILAHVSRDCNCDDCIINEVISKLCDKPNNFVIARQDKATEIFTI